MWRVGQVCLLWALSGLVALVWQARPGAGVMCYQCDSNEDDSCPAGYWFDKNINALIDCNSFEAVTPGTFCVKIVQRSPGWGAWIKETRRCGSRGFSGLTYGCRYWYEDNGVYKEECYCTPDGCNGAPRLFISRTLTFSSALVVAYLLSAIQ